jgi:predicted ATPase/class 3 adenylate cyclase
VQSRIAVSTFLFTDVEGSSRLWEQEPLRMSKAMAQHDGVLRKAVEQRRGVVVKMLGDGIHGAFDDPLDAIEAALAIQLALTDPAATDGIALKVRCGVHAGAVEARDSDFFGSAVNRAARIMGTAHGGQIIVSRTVADLVRERLSAPFALRDLGRLGLADLAASEAVYQLVHPQLRQDFPPLRALAGTPTNLPRALTSFVGREQETADVRRLLASTRLLTLLGTGGIGKTRLALKVAVDVLDTFQDGVWFIDFAPLLDPAAVPAALAQVVGQQEEAGHSMPDLLAAHLGTRQTLLVFDNCEHLLDACRRLVDTLLRAAPGCVILATSREPLAASGEQTYLLPALSLPAPKADAGDVARSDAVRLFVERARMHRPDFTLENAEAAVAELCRRLDGIPLALELAAARTDVLPVATITERLADRFRLLTGGARSALPRQQTLRALIDWSHELLSPSARSLFARLSVFADGWTLDAAEAVGCGGGIASADVLDLLADLVRKSLVEARPNAARYRMLETIRSYALERLQQSEELATARDRHHRYFCELVEESERASRDRHEVIKWLERLAAEHENLDAALHWGLSQQSLASTSLRMAFGLFRFWEMRGHWQEGRQWCAAVLERYGAVADIDARARILLAAGHLTYRLGEIVEGEALVREALALGRQGNRQLTAAALNNLSDIVVARGDFATAEALLDEAVAISRELGDTSSEMINLDNLGHLFVSEGRYEAAQSPLDRVLVLSRASGNTFAEAVALGNLGMLAYHRGEYDAAMTLATEALAIFRGLGAPAEEVAQLNVLADTARATGDMVAAGLHFREALEIGANLAYRQGIAESLSGMGALAVRLGQHAMAARLWGMADALRTAIGVRESPAHIARYRGDRDACVNALGAVRYDSLHATAFDFPQAEALAEAQRWLGSAVR